MSEKSSRFEGGWREFIIPVCIVIAGCAGCLAGAYFSDGAILGISILVLSFGVYGLGEALLGALIDVAPRMGGAILLAGFGVLAVALYSGYTLLVVE